MNPAPEAADATRALAETLAAVRYETLSPAAHEAARQALLDWLGVTLAGAVHPTAAKLRRLALALGESSEAVVFGSGARASAAAAALANAAAAHVLELDDLHAGATLHAGAPVISAAFAVAQRQHASGKALLAAIVAGYEAALRIGVAVNPRHYRHWHPTGTVATFGAAAAAGLLLGLDADAMQHALGSAGTQAAGLWEFNTDGAMSKPLHAGKAAMNGVFSADLAAAGFTGAGRILEGERGFFRALAALPARGKLRGFFAGLGSDWLITNNGFKLYPCCGHTHTAIDAALQLRSQTRGTPVRAIAIETYGPGFEIVKSLRPATPRQAQFSAAYVTAVALARGKVGLEHFTDACFTDPAPDISALLARTSISVADDLTALYPGQWPCRLTLTLEDGRILRAAANIPAGQPGNRPTRLRLQDKLLTLVPGERGVAALNTVTAITDLEDLAAFPVV